MIVISGALVLVALALLVVGLLEPQLGYVYASIAVSLAAFGFLIAGILQRRGEIIGADDLAADTPSPTFGAGSPGANVVTTSPPRGRTDETVPAGPETGAPETAAPEPAGPETGASEPEAPIPGAPTGAVALPQPYAAPEPPAAAHLDGARDETLAGQVLIVAGHPHYHAAGCRQLLGGDATEVAVRDARDEGFTPCEVCLPDQALGAQPEPR